VPWSVGAPSSVGRRCQSPPPDQLRRPRAKPLPQTGSPSPPIPPPSNTTTSRRPERPQGIAPASSGHSPAHGPRCAGYLCGPRDMDQVHGLFNTKTILKFLEKSRHFSQNPLIFPDIPIQSFSLNKTQIQHAILHLDP
jgi:hypothetical protein